MENAKKWIKDNRYWLGYLFVLSLLSFPYELFNFTLTIDEELHSMDRSVSMVWVTQQRWSMHILSYLFPPHAITPFTPLFLALMSSALAFVFVVNLFSSARST